MTTFYESLSEWFIAISQKHKEIDKNFEITFQKLTSIDENISSINENFDSSLYFLNSRIDSLSARIDKLETYHPVIPEPTPPSNEHILDCVVKTQEGLWFVNTWSGVNPFVDVIKQNSLSRLQARANNDTLYPRRDGEWMVLNGWIDKDKQSITRLDSPYFLTINGPEFLLPTTEEQVWIFQWTGDQNADVKFVRSPLGSTQTKDGTKIRLVVPIGSTGSFSVQINSIGWLPMEQISLFKEHLDINNLYELEFIEQMSKPGVIRFMDWSSVNASEVTSTEELPNINSSWWGERSKTWKPGVPVEAQIKLCKESGNVIWTNVPAMLGAPNSILSDWVQSDLDLANETREQRQQARLAITASYANTIYASDEIEKWSLNFVQALRNQGYDKNKPVIVELSNEVWNWSPPFSHQTEYFWGLTLGLKPDAKGAMRFGYGAMLGKLLLAMDKNADGQKWCVALGSHVAKSSSTSIALDGVLWTLEREERKDLISKVGVCVTTYWQGGFNPRINNNPQSNVYGALNSTDYWNLMRQDLSSLGEDRLFEKLSNWIINTVITNVLDDNSEHRDVANSYGAFFLGGYEGDCHDAVKKDTPQDMKDLAVKWFNSQQRANVTENLYQRYREKFPEALFTNYVGFGKMSIEEPWIDSYFPQINPARQVWEEIYKKERNSL